MSQTKTMPIVNNRPLSKITRKNHNNESTVSDRASSVQKEVKNKPNRQYSYNLGPVSVALNVVSATRPKRQPKTDDMNTSENIVNNSTTIHRALTHLYRII